MEVQIITPDSTLFNGEATLVVVPGIDGQIGILNNHAPLVSSLVKGVVKVKHDEKEDLFDIPGGVVEVSLNKITVLAS
tara:strand:- start:1385 stop:1618 length:234 start_codon:yes stop_codon:yes gene_type:complete